MPKKFSREQRIFFRAVANGASVFLTGVAGSGKSTCLRSLINYRFGKSNDFDSFLEQEMRSIKFKNIAVTASTGVAAMLIGGRTLHSWAGIGLGDDDESLLLRKIKKNKRATRNWKTVEILFIDEISMIHPLLFDKLEFIARYIRKNKKPFGGIQLILSGDFAQLPPVVKSIDKIPSEYLTRRFAFQSKAWDICIGDTIFLQKSFRQADPEFINLLNEVRKGILPQRLHTLVSNPLLNNVDDDFITKLYSRKTDVRAQNKKKLDEIESKEEYIFEAYDTGEKEYIQFVKKYSRYPETLRIKIGACVMLIRNIKVEQGLVNGAQGVVIDVSDDNIHVLFNKSDFALAISREDDNVEDNGVVKAKRSQFPLIPSYALTIHKSQGITCPYVEVDLSNCFEYGQAYTALSRATSLNGLTIRKLSPACVKVAPEVNEFYEKLKNPPDLEIEFVEDLTSD